MKRRNIIALLLVCAVCVGALSACGNSSTAAGSGSTEDNGPMTLFLSCKDAWLTQLEEDCEEAAAASGYTLTTVSAGNDADKQLEQIREARKSGESAFLINLVDPSRADEAIEAAGNRKVVFINRMPTDTSVLDKTHVYVGAEEKEAGTLQGNVMAEQCQSEGMKTIHYLMLTGPDSLHSSQDRANAMLKVMKDNGFDMKPVGDPINGQYSREKAENAVTALLAQGEISVDGIDLVVSTDDAMALGAMTAMQATNPKHMPMIVGVDGLPDALKAIDKGTMTMTAFQDGPQQAETAVAVANNLNHGYAYDQGITIADRIDDYIFWTSFQAVTSDNVSEFLEQ